MSEEGEDNLSIVEDEAQPTEEDGEKQEEGVEVKKEKEGHFTLLERRYKFSKTCDDKKYRIDQIHFILVDMFLGKKTLFQKS